MIKITPPDDTLQSESADTGAKQQQAWDKQGLDSLGPMLSALAARKPLTDFTNSSGGTGDRSIYTPQAQREQDPSSPEPSVLTSNESERAKEPTPNNLATPPALDEEYRRESGEIMSMPKPVDSNRHRPESSEAENGPAQIDKGSSGSPAVQPQQLDEQTQRAVSNAYRIKKSGRSSTRSSTRSSSTRSSTRSKREKAATEPMQDEKAATEPTQGESAVIEPTQDEKTATELTQSKKVAIDLTQDERAASEPEPSEAGSTEPRHGENSGDEHRLLYDGREQKKPVATSTPAHRVESASKSILKKTVGTAAETGQAEEDNAKSGPVGIVEESEDPDNGGGVDLSRATDMFQGAAHRLKFGDGETDEITAANTAANMAANTPPALGGPDGAFIHSFNDSFDVYDSSDDGPRVCPRICPRTKCTLM